MADFYSILNATAALCAGGAAASGWTASVITANTAFDGLDHGRADRMLRKVLVATAGFQAALLGIATGAALISGARAAAILCAVCALGFLTNIWTLAPRKEKALPGGRKKTSTQRVVAVALTLIMTLTALTGAVLAAFGI
ncbi:MAG: hypothetical protein B7Y90_16310 [Alphaproteobacteria bacterium 32-64-14]|nr:MAG: hypothetical protein B7Y90_16310 [Alphaproteobacteria bacterium 32-64-14]